MWWELRTSCIGERRVLCRSLLAKECSEAEVGVRIWIGRLRDAVEGADSRVIGVRVKKEGRRVCSDVNLKFVVERRSRLWRIHTGLPEEQVKTFGSDEVQCCYDGRSK